MQVIDLYEWLIENNYGLFDETIKCVPLNEALEEKFSLDAQVDSEVIRFLKRVSKNGGNAISERVTTRFSWCVNLSDVADALQQITEDYPSEPFGERWWRACFATLSDLTEWQASKLIYVFDLA